MPWLPHEPLIRITIFFGVLALMLIVQHIRPARGDGRWSRRQWVNLAMVVVDTLILRLAFPVLAVAFSVTIYQDGGGVFGMLPWPGWLEITIAVLLFDVAIYWQHRLLHIVPVLWRMHRVHHADTGFDATTGVRFHPLEMVLSMGIKLGLIALLGPHPVAVLIFEVLLSAGALFTHADFRFSERLDHALRRVVVTPSMHRIHHSSWRPETDSNYGFHLSVWDRLFGSYTTAPREDERSMRIGLEKFRNREDQGLVALLLNPFRKTPDGRQSS